MPQNIVKGIEELLEEAEDEIESISVKRAMELFGAADVAFVDLRDIRELEREGRIPGAVHCPRGTMEFAIDPKSSTHKPIFNEDRTFVFFCAGGLRSALAAQAAQRMGLKPVCHITGGFGAWRRAGGAVEEHELEVGEGLGKLVPKG